MIYKSFQEGTPNDDYWDMSMLKDFDFTNFSTGSYEIVVIPARQNYRKVKEINQYLAQFKGVVLILTGDEENVFPVEEIKHPSIKIWLMTPSREHKNVDRYLPNGYTPHTSLLKDFHTQYLAKPLDWFFSGQVTHKERFDMAKNLKLLTNGFFNESEGFTQGLSQIEYIRNMALSKIVPCPAGPITPDTFRFYEALEAGCVPIILEKNKPYFDLIFGENPIRIVKSWKDFDNFSHWFLDVYPEYNNIMFSWWLLEKKKIFNNLVSDFESVGGMVFQDDILVIIPTSPTPIHPSLSAIKEVLDSVVSRLPNSEILILADGVRGEQAKFKNSYNEYLKDLLFLIRWKYKNVTLKIFEKHHHQSGMMKKVINSISQNKILFVEHDTPLCEFIPFDTLSNVIDSGVSNFIRLHHEALILKEHKYLMLNEINFDDIVLTETAQWSQRPHLASTEFYRKVLDNFSEDSNSMIEDKMFGVVAESFMKRGRAGWNDYKLMIYTPKGDMKRSYHLDTRGKEPKFEMKF